MDTEPIGDSERVRTEVLIAYDGERTGRLVYELQTHARGLIELAIGLPAVHQPGLDLQLVAGKDLRPHAVEEPRSVRRHVGRLIGPVVEVVIAPETDVRHEDAGLDVDAIQRVEVVPAVRLGDVAVRVVEVPLPSRGARVVARRRLRVHAELGHQPGLNVLVEKVSSKSDLRQLDFVRPEHLARPGDGVVLGVGKAVVVRRVHAELADEGTPRERAIRRAVVAWRPGEVRERKGLGRLTGVGRRGRFDRRQRRRQRSKRRRRRGWWSGRRRRVRRLARGRRALRWLLGSSRSRHHEERGRDRPAREQEQRVVHRDRASTHRNGPSSLTRPDASTSKVVETGSGKCKDGADRNLLETHHAALPAGRSRETVVP